MQPTVAQLALLLGMLMVLEIICLMVSVNVYWMEKETVPSMDSLKVEGTALMLALKIVLLKACQMAEVFLSMVEQLASLMGKVMVLVIA